MRRIALISLVVVLGCSKQADEPDAAVINTGDSGRDEADVAIPSEMGTADLQPALELEERPRELLTLGEMPDGADDDPMVISVDGTVWMAFLSDRGGDNSNVYVTSTADGTWTEPSQVSEHPDDEWYPTMRRDADGVFHLVWTRVQGAPDFFQHIIYNRSTDGVTWDAASEINVTNGVADDVFGHLVIDGSELRVYFASGVRGSTGSKDLFVTTSSDGGDTWGTPVELASLNTADTEQFAWVEQVAGEWEMVFVRSAQADASNYLAPSTELYLSRSNDGLNWDAPQRITDNDQVDTLASLFVDPRTGESSISWISTDTPDGQPIDVELATSDIASYPEARIDLTADPGVQGWSPRLAATVDPDIFFVVSVATDTGEPRLYSNWVRR